MPTVTCAMKIVGDMQWVQNVAVPWHLYPNNSGFASQNLRLAIFASLKKMFNNIILFTCTTCALTMLKKLRERVGGQTIILCDKGYSSNESVCQEVNVRKSLFLLPLPMRGNQVHRITKDQNIKKIPSIKRCEENNDIESHIDCGLNMTGS